MSAIKSAAAAAWVLLATSCLVADVNAGSLTCNALIVTDNCPVWFRYKKIFLDVAENGISLFNCVRAREDDTCSSLELAVKDVFRAYYGDTKCALCCSLRKAMIEDFMDTWKAQGMTTDDEMLQHFGN